MPPGGPVLRPVTWIAFCASRCECSSGNEPSGRETRFRGLETGGLAGHEPQVPRALLGLENVVLLPHLGSANAETRIAMGMKALANVEAFAAGAPLPDRVA